MFEDENWGIHEKKTNRKNCMRIKNNSNQNNERSMNFLSKLYSPFQ
jgi:hypothetical protein